MKKMLLTVCLVLACTGFVSAQGAPSPSTPRLMVAPDGKLLSDTNRLPVDANVVIGSITVDAFPVYKDGTGTSTAAVLDSNSHVMVNIASDAIGASTLTAIENDGKIAGIASTSITFSVGTATAMLLPNIGTSRTVYIYVTEDANFGGSDVPTGTSSPFIPGGAPYVRFEFSTDAPAFWLRGRTASADVVVLPALEP